MKGVEALIAALRSGDPERQLEAARTLGELRHAAAVPSLCAALLGDDGRLQSRAAEALVRIGAPAAEPLCRLLDARNREVLLTVVRLGPVVIPFLLRALRGRNAAAARSAAWALGELAVQRPTPELREAIPLLARGSRRGDAEMAPICEIALERIEKATADLVSYPVPADAPETGTRDLPVPATSRDENGVDLPLPARGTDGDC